MIVVVLNAGYRVCTSRSRFGVEPIIPRHSDAFGQQDALDRRCLRCRVFVPSSGLFHHSLEPTQ